MSERETGIGQIPSYISAALHEIRALIHVEAQLAKAEISHNVSKMGSGIGFLVVAAILALVAFMTLAAAATIALYEAGVPLLWSVLAVGLVLLILAVIVGLVSKRRVNPGSIVPTRTLNNIRADLDAAGEFRNAPTD